MEIQILIDIPLQASRARMKAQIRRLPYQELRSGQAVAPSRRQLGGQQYIQRKTAAPGETSPEELLRTRIQRLTNSYVGVKFIRSEWNGIAIELSSK